MYHALEIQEILTDVFGHCESSDLAALARTCQTFKEPALDMLWEELYDLSPLARCLPEACRQISRAHKYSFIRPFTRTEWNTLQSYARRIRSIRHFESGLDRKSFRSLSKLPTTLLFPNLRHLRCEYKDKTMYLLHLPLPSLTSLDARFASPLVFQDSVMLFPMLSPNIVKLRLSINVYQLQTEYGSLNTDYISQWQNLQSLDCAGLALDADALVHLSRVTALAQLTFTLSAGSPDKIAPANSPLLFSHLRQLTVHSLFLHPISKLLSKTRLPVIKELTTFIQNCPPRRDLSSFMTSVQVSGAGHTIEEFCLTQTFPLPNTVRIRESLWLDSQDLAPCTSFNELRCFSLNMGWNVTLTDRDLLTLVSAWPRLESLVLNKGWGWSSPGITLHGLVRLLETRRSLGRFVFTLDTRGYTDETQLPSLGWTIPTFSLDVLDSAIEAEVVPTVAAFFSNLALCTTCDFSLRSWECRVMVGPPNIKEYAERWDGVRKGMEERFSRFLDDLEENSD